MEMKTLKSILRVQGILEGFPVKGIDGYGGEQDGSHVVFGLFHVTSKEEAAKILLSDAVSLHWASYVPNYGWHGAVGFWSNTDVSTVEMKEINWL